MHFGQLKRRELISLLGGAAAAAWPLAARAQQPAMPMIGFLSSGSPDIYSDRLRTFQQGLKEAGYVEDQNVAIEYRWDEGQTDRLPLLVQDLLRRQVALIVSFSTPAALAAKAATTTVPIVFVTGVDPVQLGLVASLNRPGGNITGFSFITGELGAKRLGLLRELRPGATRIAVLVDPKWPPAERFVSDVRAAASASGRQIEVLYVGSEREIEPLQRSSNVGLARWLAVLAGSSCPKENGLSRWRPDTEFRRSTASAIMSRPVV